MKLIPDSKFKIPNSSKRGFSLIEISIVVVIVGIISVVAVSTLWGRRSRAELDNTTRQIVTMLREAQSRSAAQEQDSAWGVYFENGTSTTPFYALFRGSSYVSSTVTSRKTLPGRVQYSTSSVSSGGSLTVTFSKISGLPSTSTSISLRLTTGERQDAPENVSRSASGLIFFDNFNRSNL